MVNHRREAKPGSSAKQTRLYSKNNERILFRRFTDKALQQEQQINFIPALEKDKAPHQINEIHPGFGSRRFASQLFKEATTQPALRKMALARLSLEDEEMETRFSEFSR